MHLTSVFYIAGAFLGFESGLTVLRLNQHSSINIVYAVFAFNFSLTCIALNQFVYAPAWETARMWNRILSVPVAFNSALMTHFVLLLTGRKKAAGNPLVLTGLYGSSASMAGLWLGGKVVSGIFKSEWGWDNAVQAENVWIQISYCIIVGLVLLNLGLIIHRYARLPCSRERNQIRSVLSAFSAGTLGWVISIGVIFVTDEGIIISLLSNISFVILATSFIFGVRWSVAKYHLMTLSPQQPAAELIGGMNDPVFLTDMNGKVIFQNKGGSDLAERAGMSGVYTMFDLFLNGESLKKEIDLLAERKKRGGYVNSTFINTHGDRSAYSITMQGIKNEDDRLIGVMLIASEAISVWDFQKRYGVTDRQVEIIYLSISGLSNREIAEKLTISERTVEHHHWNIYNKLGIENKIELYNLALKYGIIAN